MIKKPILKKYNRPNLIYENNDSFYEYHNIKKFEGISLKSNYFFLVNFFKGERKKFFKNLNNISI